MPSKELTSVSTVMMSASPLGAPPASDTLKTIGKPVLSIDVIHMPFEGFGNTAIFALPLPELCAYGPNCVPTSSP